jgi:hypothetical protein
MNEGFWEFANRIIHSEVEMGEGANLKSIHHLKLDGPLARAELTHHPRHLVFLKTPGV